MPRRMSAKPETQQAEVEREKRTESRGEWKGGSSFGNSGTELVDESVGGYRRLSRRRATRATRNKRDAVRRNGKRRRRRSQADRRTGQRRAQKRKREKGERERREGGRERENTFPASI